MRIEKVYQNALFSEASYANLQNKFSAEDVKAALIAEGFSQRQAEDFVSHWRVANHQPDTTSGFSATLFENLDTPGSYTLAIRGTANAADLSSDIWGIGALGVARDQAYDLYNWFQRLITPASGNVGQWVKTEETEKFLGVEVPHYVYQSDAAAGLGVIVDATGQNTDFDARLEVAGHSLGGHLALAFSRLFPDWASGNTISDACAEERLAA